MAVELKTQMLLVATLIHSWLNHAICKKRVVCLCVCVYNVCVNVCMWVYVCVREYLCVKVCLCVSERGRVKERGECVCVHVCVRMYVCETERVVCV